MITSRKELIKAAKSNIADRLLLQIGEIQEEIDDFTAQIEAELEETPDGEVNQELNDARNELFEKYHVLERQLEELNRKKKSFKKELKRSLEWTGQREETAAQRDRVKISDPDGLSRVREAEQKKSKIAAGEWLYEGALVRHRSSVNALLVLGFRGDGTTVELLDGARKVYLRHVSLRPFDTED